MNIQNGDTNNEEISNTLVNENVQQQAFKFENGGYQTIIVNPNQSGVAAGGQNPDSSLTISTSHAMTLLFGCIGLAVFCLCIFIGLSCYRRAKKNKSKAADKELTIIRTKREDKIIEIMEEIKKIHTPEPTRTIQIANDSIDSFSDSDESFNSYHSIGIDIECV